MESAENKCYMVTGFSYVGATMNDMPNPDQNKTNRSDSTITPKLNADGNPSEASPPAAGAAEPAPNGRVAANTALLKIGKNSAEVSKFDLTPFSGNKSAITPNEENDDTAQAPISQEYRRQAHIELLAEEIQLTERAKKAEEDRRRKADAQQKPVFALKKNEEAATVLNADSPDMGTEQHFESAGAEEPVATTSAFETAPVRRKSRIGLVIGIACMVLIGLMGGAAWMAYNFYVAYRSGNLTKALLARAPIHDTSVQKAVEEVKESPVPDAESARPKLPLDETAKKADEEKRLRDENERLAEIANREKDEQRKKVETAQLIAREKLKKEQEEDVAKIEQARIAKAAANPASAEVAMPDSAKTDEPKTSVAKSDEPKTPAVKTDEPKTVVTKSDEPKIPAVKTEEPKTVVTKSDESKTPAAKSDEPKTVVTKSDEPKTPAAKSDEPKTVVTKSDEPKTPAAKIDEPKTVVTKSDIDKPAATNPVAAPSADIKSIPSAPPSIPDKLDLPAGGVRLIVKATDPEGGKLAFKWSQLKGAAVAIADPAAAQFRDGNWISQTYFVASRPGNYEFEVTIKNDDGGESKKYFPIEVLPPTELK